MEYIIGIDEVGRGPIAGPVAVGAFACQEGFFDSLDIDVPLRDSKKLTKKQREKWFTFLKEEKEKGNCDFAVSFVSNDNIDKFGISKSIKKALETSMSKLNLNPETSFIYLDGGLKAPEIYINQETIIKGDELHPVISCASIVAKVSRDKVMTNFSLEYKDYGFDKNSGYGTKSHYEAIKKHGLTKIHRKSFL